MIHCSKIKLTLAMTAALTALVGCSSPGNTVTFDQLPDPAATPKAKWSDAMVYMNAMQISGMRDVPREMMGDASSQPAQGGNSTGVLDAATYGVGAVAPPSGMSGGAVAGVGLGLLLLGGGPTQPAQLPQVVAWVPSDLASSPEEAVQVALNEFNKSRAAVFQKQLPQELIATAYPESDSRSFGGKMPKASNLVLFSEEAKESPAFISAPKSYGPIHIVGHKVTEESIINASGFRNIHGSRANTVALSASLPDWFLIYVTSATRSKSDKLPPAVLRSGMSNYFIGK